MATGARAGNPNAGHEFKTGIMSSAGGSVPVGGIKSTGADFDIDPGGEVKIGSDGDLKAELSGLVRASDGADTFEELFASLVCAGAVVASTDPSPLEDDGTVEFKVDGFIDASIVEECRGPIVIFRRNGCTVDSGCGSDDPQNTRWLAISGFLTPEVD
jgi:hypothetical protein